jgi:hypothetical protein
MIGMMRRINPLKSRAGVLRSSGLFLLALSLAASLAVCFSFRSSVNAQAPGTLVAMYSPVLHFTGGEKFYPTRVDYLINRSTLVRHSTGIVEVYSPTADILGTYTSSDYYLNNTLGTEDAIAADYALEAKADGYCAYVHVVSSGNSTVIQYWLFYAYNNGPLNDHQGDIEVVEVFLDSSGTPQTLLCSQHFAGENAGWGDVEKVDTHPVVYVAQGSHANYFRSYQGKIGLENDIVGSDGITVTFNETNLEVLGSQPWLNYAGRWGYWGTDEEVAAGMAGPLGPVFNQGGIRWAQPQNYLGTTFSVGNLYFILAWLIAYFLLLFIIYVVVRGGWKAYGIVKLKRKGGLLVGKFLKSRGGPSLMLGIAAIVIALVALFLPWYTISASSDTGPLAKQGGVTLVTINGISGLQVNMFMGSGESTSGFRSLFSAQLPFLLIFLAGLILLALDVIGFKNGKKLGNKFIFGAITSLFPFILIFAFIMILPTFLPWASAILPGQQVPPQVDTMVRAVAGNPVYGTNSQTFPVVGLTTVSWGFGIGAYLFLVAAAIRIVAGIMMRSTPEIPPTPASTAPLQPKARPSPPPSQSQQK